MTDTHPIRAFRQRQTPQLSQEQLADRIGVTRFTVMRWEQGEPIDENRVLDVVRETGISAKELRPDLLEKLQRLMGSDQ
jgi:DNA-binding transcriptional regulator YiaG